MHKVLQTDYLRPGTDTLLSDNWGTLSRHEFDLRRRDGVWQTQVREVYDRGNGAACLLHNPDADTVLLTRQFRLPVLSETHDGYLYEVPAGLLEGSDPATRMRAELEEETGFVISALDEVFRAVMSPGSVTEFLVCFTGTYRDSDRMSEGGGNVDEGEDIEVVHMTFDAAMGMVADGTICDAKTIMLLQHLALTRLS